LEKISRPGEDDQGRELPLPPEEFGPDKTTGLTTHKTGEGANHITPLDKT